jgi:hypothetical protein
VNRTSAHPLRTQISSGIHCILRIIVLINSVLFL